MELKEYRLMYELEERHWWFQGRLMMTEGMLQEYVLPAFAAQGAASSAPAHRPRLLDLGCGTGLFLQRRAADCDAFGMDLSQAALSYCRSRGLHTVALADAAHIPAADASFDIVTAFDLIEHLRDDQGLIDEIWRVLRPGGFFLATVPAHPILWTGHDVSLHHHRRYVRRTFSALFGPARWQQIRLTASFCLIFPPAALIRLIHRFFNGSEEPHSDTRPTIEWLNRLLISLHRLEAGWLRRHDLPVGISFMTIQRKKP